jgi:hypothetical protein
MCGGVWQGGCARERAEDELRRVGEPGENQARLRHHTDTQARARTRQHDATQNARFACARVPNSHAARKAHHEDGVVDIEEGVDGGGQHLLDDAVAGQEGGKRAAAQERGRSRGAAALPQPRVRRAARARGAAEREAAVAPGTRRQRVRGGGLRGRGWVASARAHVTRERVAARREAEMRARAPRARAHTFTTPDTASSNAALRSATAWYMPAMMVALRVWPRARRVPPAGARKIFDLLFFPPSVVPRAAALRATRQRAAPL